MPLLAVLLIASIFLAGCAAKEPRLLSYVETEELYAFLSRQDLKVENFFATGHLTIEGESYSKAPILLVGRRKPLALRIEITHPWGKPLAHMLFEDYRFVMVSFQESKCYFGDSEALQGHSGFPPSLSPLELWGLARGYPPLEGLRPLGSREGEIKVSGLHGNSEKIILLEGRVPKKALFPSKGLEISYENLHQSSGAPFARQTAVLNTIDGQTLTIKRDEVHFNTILPEALFILDIPPGFEKVRVTGFKPKDPEATKKDQL